MVESFGDRLAVAIRETGPLCVGLDPSRALVQAWGRDDDPQGLEFFALQVIEAVAGVAAVVKPQVAYFERFGSRGLAVLERVITEARAHNLMVVADAKRGDIGSTNDAYAEAWLDNRSPLASDALTVNPYLGVGAMEGLIQMATERGRGIYVVVASSNDEGRPVQTARVDTGEHVEDFLLRELAERNEAGPGTLGALGAVVGATRQSGSFDLAQLRGTYLVPGVGAQGATPEDVGRLFARCPKGSVLVNASRSILAQGPERRGLHDASRRLRDDLSNALL